MTRHRGIRLLSGDDEAQVCFLLGPLLQHEGYSVTTAEGGRTALRDIAGSGVLASGSQGFLDTHLTMDDLLKRVARFAPRLPTGR